MVELSKMERFFFRKDAVFQQRLQPFGSVLVHQPWGYSIAALLTIMLMLVAVTFAYYGTYTLKARVVGLLLPDLGMLRLTANGTGILSQVLVSEGQQVDAGEVLFVISAERISSAGGTQKLISEQLTQRALLLERNRVLASDRRAGQLRMADSRLESIRDEVGRFHDELRFLKRRVELAQAHMHRQKELVTAKFVSVAQLQQAEADLLALQGQQQSLQRAYANLERERTELMGQRQDIELRHRSDISEIDSGLTLLKQEQAENDVRIEQVSIAPFPGTVTGLNVQPGQQVQAGTLLASLIPKNATLTAHVYVAPGQVGFIEPGQPVLMRYVAYPYQKFGMAKGKVLSLTKAPYALQELPVHIASAVHQKTVSVELYYRVIIELDSQSIAVYGKALLLQAGMLLEADIIQDKRRLYEWMLEPIYSITGKMGGGL